MSDLLSDLVTQSSLRLMEPLSKVFNRSGILLGFLASFFTFFELDGKVISPLISRDESLC
jgi:hypothetical protein